MNWALNSIGGEFETRLKNAENSGDTDSSEILELRNLESVSNMFYRNLSLFISKLENIPQVVNSRRLKNIKIKIVVINSSTFVEDRCIAWINKANKTGYGQCCKKLREGRFCGFHRASKPHIKPITTIYDNMGLHTLFNKKLSLKLLSANTNVYNCSDLSSCYKIYWKQLDIYINPESQKMFYKLGREIECIGYNYEDDDILYSRYLSKLNKI